MNQKEKQIFFRFLKSHNIHGLYLKYLFEDSYKRNHDFRNVSPRQAISGAFLWHETKEGTKFWVNINTEWRQKLDDYYNGKEV